MPDLSGFGDGWIPPVAFHFSVRIDNDTLAFQEVSGLSVEMQTETVPEGGENRLVHELPTSLKCGRVELKRAIAKTGDPLIAWCRDVLESDFSQPIQPKQVFIFLLDMQGQPLRGWTLVQAYPVKWSVDGFSSTKNELAIESITLACTGVVRIQES